MKKLLLSLCIFLSAFDGLSQVTDIDSFYMPGTMWRYRNHVQWNGGGGGCEDIYWSYKIERDSIINGMNYHLLSGKDIGYAACTSPITFVNIDYDIFGGIRVDGRKVYFLLFDTVSTVGGLHPFVVSNWRESIKDNYTPGTEYILYDFDLNINGTLTWKPGYYVSDIDSVTISNGQQLKRYTFLVSGGGDGWIEGIGSVCNLLMSRHGVTVNNLICYNGVMGSLYNDAQLCNTISTAVNEQITTERALSFYPNPLNGSVLQFSTSKQIGAILITDISGKTCEKHTLHQGQNSVNTSLATGMYFIKVQYKDGSTETQKLIKN